MYNKYVEDISKGSNGEVVEILSKGSDYHTQRNNKNKPIGTCLVTSYVMAAKQAGVRFGKLTNERGKSVQPEDWLYEQLQTEQATNTAIKLAPWAFAKDGTQTVPNHEIHIVVARLFFSLTRPQARVVFTESGTVAEVCEVIAAGGGCVVSGSFEWDNDGKVQEIGHVVSIAGFVHAVKNGKAVITHMVIDDPFGNYHEQYRDDKGFNIRVPLDDFIDRTRKNGAIWCHKITRR